MTGETVVRSTRGRRRAGPAGGQGDRGAIKRVIGIDISDEALKDLRRARRRPAPFELVKGDAFFEKGPEARPEGRRHDHLCSILHEIYSYVPQGRKFNLDSVKAMLESPSLEPGGLMIRRLLPMTRRSCNSWI